MGCYGWWGCRVLWLVGMWGVTAGGGVGCYGWWGVMAGRGVAVMAGADVGCYG